MDDEMGLDVVGVGKLAKAIPAKAWTQLVDTACSTFRESIAPFTAITSGIGRLIDAKFDRLVDAEKVLAAESMAKARKKVIKSKKTPSGMAKANIVIAAIQASGSETDTLLRDLWSNLLAQEIVNGDVHPEFPSLLSRLSRHDAYFLAKVAETEKNKSAAMKATIATIIASVSLGTVTLAPFGSFTSDHLKNLNLITQAKGSWVLTRTGNAFIQAVSDPASA